MLQDLAALTPPLIVFVAVIIGVIWLLRREMAPKRRSGAADQSQRANNDSVGPREHDRRT
jgi:flagellar biogenesis protein FliO